VGRARFFSLAAAGNSPAPVDRVWRDGPFARALAAAALIFAGTVTA